MSQENLYRPGRRRVGVLAFRRVGGGDDTSATPALSVADHLVGF
ncbi:MAG TPA: hypothetical protein VK775_13825 [Chthoniobacterales bacterium]|nr:hypothetical protein [Chthoniobacterales bacterium]